MYILNCAHSVKVAVNILTACYTGHLSVNITVNHTMNLLFSIFMYLTIKVMYV